MSWHIEPRSVRNYLSGICDQLEIHFPSVRSNRMHALVTRTLAGCLKLRSKPVNRKLPLDNNILLSVVRSLNRLSSYDDVLFTLLLLTGTIGLMRLGELTVPLSRQTLDCRKLTKRSSLILHDSSFQFVLPYHKADNTFEGNTIIVIDKWNLCPALLMSAYTNARDKRFPLNPYLWVTMDGSHPSRSWFLTRLRQFVADERFAGQSMRAGGATLMAQDGALPHVIQAAGRWSSDTWRIYIRKNPVLIDALLNVRR